MNSTLGSVVPLAMFLVYSSLTITILLLLAKRTSGLWAASGHFQDCTILLGQVEWEDAQELAYRQKYQEMRAREKGQQVLGHHEIHNKKLF